MHLDFDASGRIMDESAWDAIHIPYLAYKGASNTSRIDGKGINESQDYREEALDQYYQCTNISKPETKPQWNQHFVFALNAVSSSERRV